MKKIIIAIFGIFTFNALVAQTNLTEAVDFTVKDVHGELYQLFDILDNQEKYVLIDFFSIT